MTRRRLQLIFEAIHEALVDPSARGELDELAKEGSILLYDEADRQLVAANDELARGREARGEAVVRVSLERRISFASR